MGWKPGQRVAEPVANFRDLVMADLQRAVRLVQKIDPDPIDPQFRLATPEGDLWLGISLPDGESERLAVLSLIGDLMALKQARAFTLASEIAEPDGLLCLGVSPKNSFGVVSLISRHPLQFAKPVWLDQSSLDPVLVDLLPKGSKSLSATRLLELQSWFGRGGKFPAVALATGQEINI